MKALKLKSSPDSDPVWADVKAGPSYTRVVASPVPVIYDIKSISSLAKNIIIESDKRQFLRDYELVNVGVKIKRAVKELPHIGDTVFN